MRKPREDWRRVDSDTGSLTKKKKDKTMTKEDKKLMSEYNNVIMKTDCCLHSLVEFKNYNILAIVNGILYSVFSIIYAVAPSWPAAKDNIIKAIEHFEAENEL